MLKAARIRNEAAIDQPLDHTSRAGTGRPRTYPADLDCVIHVPYLLDNSGRLLAVDFKYGRWDWGKMSAGQRLVYWNLVRNGGGHTVAAIASHNVDAASGRRVNSRHDVTQFQVAWAGHGRTVNQWHRPLPGDRWEEFVCDWYDLRPEQFAARWLTYEPGKGLERN